MCIAVNCSWSFVYYVIILCLSVLTHVYLLYYMCIAVLHALVARLLARSRYSECPATGHLGTVFLGFPVSISECWDGSRDSKLPLHASHVDLQTYISLDPFFIFMYMHYNHCHWATAHLQLNILYYYYKYRLHMHVIFIFLTGNKLLANSSLKCLILDLYGTFYQNMFLS